MTVGPVAQVPADDPDEGPEPVPECDVAGHRAQRPVGILGFGADGLGERCLGRERSGRLIFLHPGLDRGGEGGVGLLRGPELFQGGEGNLGLLAGLADQADGDLLDVLAGVAEQPLVDVADLLDVDVAEGNPPSRFSRQAGELDSAQDLQHHPIGDGDRQQAVFVDGGEERETVRVEQRAAIGLEIHPLERCPSVQRLGGGEEPVPGQVGGVESLTAVLSGPGIEGVELVADPVSHGEEPALREQAAFLGEKQEHHPHHHGDGRLVDLGSLGWQRIRGTPIAGRRPPPRTWPVPAARPRAGPVSPGPP